MELTRPAVVAVAVFLATAVAVPALFAGSVGAQQAQTVDSCTTISESGTYELNGSVGVANASAANATADAENATGTEPPGAGADGVNESEALANDTAVDAEDVPSCVVVEADDVVFDGNGFVLDGGNVSALNLSADEAAANATNVSADEPAAVNGITVRPANGTDTVSNVTIRDVTVRNWYVGVSLQNATDVTLANVTYENNTVPGFRVDNTTNLQIQSGNDTATAAE